MEAVRGMKGLSHRELELSVVLVINFLKYQQFELSMVGVIEGLNYRGHDLSRNIEGLCSTY